MWKLFFAYVPVVILLVAAACISPIGKNWGTRQLLLTIAFFWMTAAIVWRVTRATTIDRAIDKSSFLASEETSSTMEPPSSGPVPLEYHSPQSEPITTSDGRAASATLCILFGVIICGMGLAILFASVGLDDPDVGRSVVILLVGGGLCAIGMNIKRRQ